MPFFTIYSSALQTKKFLYAKNERHAFDLHNHLQKDPEACIENGFDFQRVWSEVKRKWVSAEDKDVPDRVNLLMVEVNGARFSKQVALDVIAKLTPKYTRQGLEAVYADDVMVAVEDLAKIWLAHLGSNRFPEDITEQDQDQLDRQDLHKIYQCSTVDELVAALQKQQAKGRGKYVICRSADPYRGDSPSGVSLKVGVKMLWINDYESE
jgi:hypothetical protein